MLRYLNRVWPTFAVLAGVLLIFVAGCFAYVVVERGSDFAYSNDTLLWFAETIGRLVFLCALSAVMLDLMRDRR